MKLVYKSQHLTTKPVRAHGRKSTDKNKFLYENLVVLPPRISDVRVS